MNVFSHYFLVRDNYSNLYKFGNIFPDLINIYDRKQKDVLLKAVMKIDKESEGYIFYEGVKNHLSIDKKFHASTFFREGISALKIEFSKFDRDKGNRSFIIFHILFELILDRHIILRNEQAVDNFYDEFSVIDYNYVDLLLNCGDQDEQKRFSEFMQDFLKRKHIYNYKNISFMGQVLERIMQRSLNLTHFPTQDPHFESKIINVHKNLASRIDLWFDQNYQN